jgi:hypothetical protein
MTESNVTHLLHHLNRSDLSNSLFFASYSITETPLHVRNSFLSFSMDPESRFGYYYLQLSALFGSVNNVAWTFSLAEQLRSTHRSCLWRNAGSESLTFLAKKVRLNDDFGEQGGAGEAGDQQDRRDVEDLIHCHTLAGCQLESIYFCNI